ncbi:MAG: hypothetical protein JXB23_03455 [Candidatus Aminicenantes bacterium]|nr:hypothetical protein [Candidatus Aminicenantes bacterium]
MRFHDLRHIFASNCVIKGENRQSLHKILGHLTTNFTFCYAHLVPEFIVSEIRKRAYDILFLFIVSAVKLGNLKSLIGYPTCRFESAPRSSI